MKYFTAVFFLFSALAANAQGDPETITDPGSVLTTATSILDTSSLVTATDLPTSESTPLPSLSSSTDTPIPSSEISSTLTITPTSTAVPTTIAVPTTTATTPVPTTSPKSAPPASSLATTITNVAPTPPPASTIPAPSPSGNAALAGGVGREGVVLGAIVGLLAVLV